MRAFTIFMWLKYFCDSTKFLPLVKNPVWIPAYEHSAISLCVCVCVCVCV